MIGDLILTGFSLYFARSIQKKALQEFEKYWMYFFYTFTIVFFVGGLGHLLFKYTGLIGKYPSWIIGLFIPYFVEQAMISIYPKKGPRKIFDYLSKIKLALACIASIFIFSIVDLNADISRGLMPTTINTAVGLIFALVILGGSYLKIYSSNFKYFIFGFLCTLPAAVIIPLKINIAQWFDRNDLSHVFLLIGLCFYYIGVKKNSKRAKALSLQG